MQNEGFLDQISRSFSVSLPDSNNMDSYLDEILPMIRPWSEDLYEQNYYLDTRWLEIRDDENFHDIILHIFRDKGEYLIVRDGDINRGSWKILSKSNTMILEYGNKNELYDLAFLNADFFVLRKHGDQRRKGMRKYFVLGRENLVRRLDWRDIMELMFNLYRSNSKTIIYVAILVVIVAAIIIFSIL